MNPNIAPVWPFKTNFSGVSSPAFVLTVGTTGDR